MPIPLSNLDDRTFADLVEEMRALIPRYAPTWTDHNVSDPGITLIELLAWLTEALIYRLNRIPEASEARFLELLGATFHPAQPATVTLTVTADGLEKDLIVPRNMPLTASPGEGSETLPFETTHDLRLTPDAPSGTVVARQAAPVQDERLGVSNGQVHQVFRLAQPFLVLDPEAPYPTVPQVEVDGEAWTFESSLLAPTAKGKYFTAEPRLNAIRFGDGCLGQIPPEGAEIVASYRYTLGKQGNVPSETTFSFDEDFGVSLSIVSAAGASGGADPTDLEEARDQAIGALKTRWRAITTEDFEELVLGQADFSVARVKCLPELDLTSSDPDTLPSGHVSVIVVPRPILEVSPEVPVNVMVFSPDGGRLAIVADDRTARLWDAESGEETAVLPHNAPVNAVVFSPDGRRLATVGDDHTIRLWDVESGDKTAVLPHDAPVNAVVFSPDGRRLATANDNHTARLWDAESGEETAVLPHDAPVSAMVFSPDGKRLATASDDHTARLWEAESGEEIAVLPHDAPVNAVVFSPDGQRLATAYDNTARLWDRLRDVEGEEETVVLLHELPHEAPVNAVVFSPDGQRLATADDDNTARLWDTESGEEIVVLFQEAPVNAVFLSPDGKWLATAGDNLPQVWDMESGEQVTVLYHEAPVKAIAFNPDGRFLATVVTVDDDTIVQVWQVTHIRDIWEFLDERRLVTCRHHVVGPNYNDVKVQAQVVHSVRFEKETLKDRIGDNLKDFFHPLSGGPGPEKNGWPFGRDVYASEVYQVIEGTQGVDHVESLTLYTRENGDDWTKAGDQIAIAPNNLVHFVAHEIQVWAAR